MGLLKGIYLFEKESSIEYKDWAADVPKNYFGCILDEWKKRPDSQEDNAEVDKYIKENFPGWG